MLLMRLMLWASATRAIAPRTPCKPRNRNCPLPKVHFFKFPMGYSMIARQRFIMGCCGFKCDSIEMPADQARSGARTLRLAPAARAHGSGVNDRPVLVWTLFALEAGAGRATVAVLLDVIDELALLN